ncbi:nitrilase-related carbon-nitrogen hydrolase [Pseudomonas entomophila]|uniref:nitrilase-related carbon-nitrogen hydrolase n=1 Tax=Pseudomonas entomophila TaxID=312306 RepID=UPI003EBE5A44
MRKFLVGAFVLTLLLALGSYGVWTLQRPEGHYLSDLRITVALDHGTPSERGNLLGIEPLLYPVDYQNLQRLHRKLAAYLEHARALGMLTPKTVVVLPEHVGTWLWARGEKNELYQVPRRREALQWLEISNPVRYGLAVLMAEGEDRRGDAHLRMKAGQMAADYQALFGGLAKEFGVTLVAGSIVLPTPYAEQGTLYPGTGALFNCSVVFDATGAVLGQPQRQRFPDGEVRRFIKGEHQAPLHTFATPAGTLGILVGSDSWYPQNHRQLAAQSVDLVANPAFLGGRNRWTAPWRGNRHQPLSAQLPVQPGAVSEQAAWQTLLGAPAHQTTRMTVFLRGQFWEMGSDGQGFAGVGDQLLSGPPHAGARLLNVWL